MADTSTTAVAAPEPAPTAAASSAASRGAEAFSKGALSGMASALVLQPLDVVKTRQQGLVAAHVHSAGLGRTVTEHAGHNASRVSAKHAVSEILAQDGPGGLWRGLRPTIARAALGPGVYFVMLDMMQGRNRSNADRKLTVFVEGAVARAIAGTLLCPLSVVKTRFEYARDAKMPSVWSTLVTIAREERLPGLFRGAVPTLIRDVPSSGLYLMFYQSVFQPRLRAHFENHSDSSSVINVPASLAAGVLATLLTHPFDVVRTTVQLNNVSLREGVIMLWQARGAAGFAQGLMARILRRPINMCITWTLYEKILAK
ncbi:Solute carrier family 25 member 38 [Hondaea fermentalgiana]|uniref:Solute carrier family 25 member 38 n=1 Tax=Hondaea fermentalgiana TaxID=2315210 RepID=A0A2R5G6H4_9STRA|nr:Solute carrier family 25 member 38 [Hondaea fermentalgiana]|eukprot:GBG26657.1 Solute carrier family 25 member 38 [Hondaea fermentalgiana]